MKKVKCIKTFLVEMYDDDGFIIENSDYVVPKDSIWDIQEFSLRIIDGEIRLLNDDLGWIEITTERFLEYFKVIDELIMKYIHPKHYEGLKFDTPNNQNITRAMVEEYCLKCELFMGKEHDFSECETFDKRENGKVVKKKTCPFDSVAVSLFYPQINCEIEK